MVVRRLLVDLTHALPTLALHVRLMFFLGLMTLRSRKVYTHKFLNHLDKEFTT
jgi:hypothetical protein